MLQIKMSFLVLTTMLLLGASHASAQPALDCALDILLTNDDGWDAPGIQAIRKALLAAHHRVTLVAPLEQQSGRGGGINTDVGAEVAVVEQSPGVWSVDGTPTDSVRAGLDVIMRADWPDLVVSGANFGPNIGQEGVHNSGTLGAALAAHYDGLPAIAVSNGIVIDEHSTSPRFKSTLESFATSGAIVANLISEMSRRHGCEQVMPDGLAVNINVPVPVASIKGIRYAPLSAYNMFRLEWGRGEDGKVRVGFRFPDMSSAQPGDDANLFSRGFVTVTPINGDITMQAIATSTGMPEKLADLLPTD